MTDSRIDQILGSFPLNKEQYLAAATRGRDVVATAGAGSGKTLTLVARYTSLLAEGIQPRRIAAITFTTKAAREMRARVRATLVKLQENSTTENERQYWTAIFAQMDAARISTIHSLCAEILRAHPAEAGIDPRFEVVDESVSAAIRLQAVEDTLKTLVETEKYLPLLTEISTVNLKIILTSLLHRRLEAHDSFSIQTDHLALILEILRERMDHPTLKKPINSFKELTHNALISDAGEPLANMVQDLLQLWTNAESAIGEGELFKSIEMLFKARRTKMKLNSGKRTSWVKEEIKEFRDNFDKLINPLTGGADSTDQPPDPETEALFSQLQPLLWDAFEALNQNYMALLENRQALDFDDLEYIVRQLLNNVTIREHWQGELDAILVDEFQDTNRRQQEIIEALAGSPGRLFIVGDMRQSIYRFRQADVTVFKKVQERINAAGGQEINLPLTYRTHQPLLLAIDDLLSPVIGTQPDPARDYYVPYLPLEAHRKEPLEYIQPPYIEFLIGAGENSEFARPMAAQALALRLLQLKEEGQIQNWDEVALLFRASTSYADYETALEEAGIPFVTVAGRGFYDRPEIRDLINILRALADPTDDLAFAGLLRSPAFGLSDVGLYLLRQSNLSYWETLQADLSMLNDKDQKRANYTLEVVSQLLPLVDRIPVAELLAKIVNLTHYRAILATADVKNKDQKSRSSGGRLWRNLDKLLTDALASEELRVRNYLEMLVTLNDAGAREGEASAEAKGAVQLMTIHKAKGLEFNIVVLAAAGRGPRPPGELLYFFEKYGASFKLDPQPILYKLARQLDKDQDEMEQLRLLYVALTRAKEKLLISAHATPNKNGEFSFEAWAKMLFDSAGLPVLDYSDNHSEPFFHQTDSNYPLRVWCLQQNQPALEVIVSEEIEETIKGKNLPPLYQPIQIYDFEQPFEEKEEQIESTSWRTLFQDKQQTGKTLGKMVHKAIERWHFPDKAGLEQMLETEALRSGIVQEEQRQQLIQQATVLLERLQAHPIWAEINSSAERHHEIPYTLKIGNKTETGYIDLLYRNTDRWKIIEFKTDPIYSPEQKRELLMQYTSQVQRYKRAVSQFLGTDAEVNICFLDDHGEVVLEKR
jgi:ATP-dependent helicase/nuclease subunit A